MADSSHKQTNSDASTLLAQATCLGLIVFIVVANVWFSKEIKDVHWLFDVLVLGLSAMLSGKVKRSPDDHRDAVEIFLTSRKLLLIVDDSPTHLIALRNGFESKGFNGIIREAKSCEEALEVLRSDDIRFSGLPDVVILDMKFPTGTMQGSEFIRKVREDHRLAQLRICSLSRSAESDYEDDILDNISCFVQKGQGIDVLVEVLALTTSKHHKKQVRKSAPNPLSERLLELSGSHPVFKSEDDED
ncbi:MAG TPA: response regulator [Drouetiella sp.]